MVGGGLAGVAAALGLADRGWRVSLIERHAELGGLCRSVPDDTAGRVDTGQHVYLGCCQELEALLARLGVRPAIRQDRLELTVVDRTSGAWRRLRSWRLPAPGHLAPVLLRWPGLPRWAATRAGAVATALRESDPGLDEVPARAWLQSLGQPEALIELVWEPFLVSATNVGLDRCSAELAAFVIRRGLLSSPGAGALRIPGTDLTRWLDPPARAALRGAQVELRLGHRAISVTRQQSGWRVELAEGDQISCEVVVLAVPAAAGLRLVSQLGESLPGLTAAAALPLSPIVNVHLFTDRPFLPGPVVVVPASPLQWLFDRSAIDSDADASDFHTAISISAADREVTTSEAELISSFWALCQTTFPAAARAHLRQARATREANATFAPIPGSASARPDGITGLPGLLLAGSWTDTGWPATMEGAVRSGNRAAAAAMARVRAESQPDPSPTSG